MSDFGIRVKNIHNEFLIGSAYRVPSVWSTGTVNSPSFRITLNSGGSGFPLVAIRRGIGAIHSVNMNADNTVCLSVVVSIVPNTPGVPAEWRIYQQLPREGIEGDYGFIVRDESNQVVFNANTQPFWFNEGVVRFSDLPTVHAPTTNPSTWEFTSGFASSWRLSTDASVLVEGVPASVIENTANTFPVDSWSVLNNRSVIIEPNRVRFAGYVGLSGLNAAGRLIFRTYPQLFERLNPNTPAGSDFFIRYEIFGLFFFVRR